MYYKRKPLVAVVVASLGVALVADSVHASCAGSNDPVELLWSYPTDGQEGVPLDTQVRLVLDTHLYDNGWKATLNGVPVTRDMEVFSFAKLEPNTSYTFRLEGHQPRSITEQSFELHFRTGEGSTAELSAPDVLGAEKIEKLEDSGGLCERVDRLYACRDTPSFDLRGIMLEAEGAIGWLDYANNFWPVSCQPWIDLGPNVPSGRCVEMRAVAADGSVSESTEFCAADEMRAMSRTEGQSAAAATSPGACAVAAPGQRATGTAWLGSMLLLLAARLRRKRH